MSHQEEAVRNVGPLRFVGAAADRVARVREDNDYEAIDVAQWRANVEAQHEKMSEDEVEFFKTLRSKVS